MTPPRILITRALEDGEALGEAIAHRGGKAIFLPLHRVIPLEEAAPASAVMAVLATSAKAFHQEPAIPETLKRLPVFCVGQQTADMATAAGFTQVHVAEGSAQSLIALAEHHGLTGQSLLYLAGTPRRPAIEEWAARNGGALALWLRYRVEPVPYGKAELAAIFTPEPAAILHFSPESARRFVDQCRQNSMLDRAVAPVHACFSDRVAEALLAAFAPTQLAHQPLIASRPSPEALLDTVFSALAHQSGD